MASAQPVQPTVSSIERKSILMFKVMQSTKGEVDGKNHESWLQSDVSNRKIFQHKKQSIGSWTEIRLFISSTFVDTQAERDILVKRVIPSLNRTLAARFIRLVPVDLRWGVLSEEAKNCRAIQKTCLNQIDKCRQSSSQSPWFIGLRTERYGWVQDDYMPSDEFENPTLYSWIDELKKEETKKVSITSLECIHAAQVPEELPLFPTVFFYNRIIENPEDIEEDLRWLFEFEYVSQSAHVDPKVEKQYNRTEDPESYRKDKERLNDILQQLPYVRWSTYTSHYSKGSARLTGERPDGKSFGVGYVDQLDEFERKVEQDLLKAVEANFPKLESYDLSPFELEGIQHESRIKEKSSTFVGRSDLLKVGIDHCITEKGSNVMIFHGEPGCGKSGLLSAISKEVLTQLRENGHFVFAHVVDSCPGSNILEKMLRRLQLCLRKYRRQLGETSLPAECPQSVSDLKEQHHKFLLESANKYPDKLFVVSVDAVNQLHKSLQAWKMWWLPGETEPANLRFLISSLDVENGTFENACHASPHATKVPVGVMSYDDRKEMISTTLSRYNKKVNPKQMDLLLSKNKSPLYIYALCEAIRKFGIYEHVEKYISKLPNDISSLFSFLLDEWSDEYGAEIIEDVASFLYVSKHGLMENEINDLLYYKGKKTKGENELLFGSSFSRSFDSLSSFLSAGGGGFLHFFHDQLKFTVKEKYLKKENSVETYHKWLADFYYDSIRHQLKEIPDKEPPEYYGHALQQIVYHQIGAMSKYQPQEAFKQCLRNIYFVRERVKMVQKNDLIEDYVDALENISNNQENQALQQWSHFARIYASNIWDYPEFCHNIAMNQSYKSIVKADTAGIKPPKTHDGYPLYWTNSSAKEDCMVGKYALTKDIGYVDCAVSPPIRNIACAGAFEETVVFNLRTGEIMQKLRRIALSVCFSSSFDVVWTGDDRGEIYAWDLDTAVKIGKVNEKLTPGPIIWMEMVGDIIICGTGEGKALCYGFQGVKSSTIGLINAEKMVINKQWSTQLVYCFCYDSQRKLIFSAHEGLIQGWDLAGNVKVTFRNSGPKVYSLCCHPSKDVILSGSQDLVIRQWSISDEKLKHSFKVASPELRDPIYAIFDRNGERILSVYKKILRIYSNEGILQHELTGHLDGINTMSLVPDSNQLLSGDHNGTFILWNLPTSSSGNEKSLECNVTWCEFVSNGDSYLTLSEDGFLQSWETKTMKLKASAKVDLYIDAWWKIDGGISIHPSGEFICIGKRRDLNWYKLPTLDLYHSFKCKEGKISSLAISSDGSMMLVGASKTGGFSRDCNVFVFDIDNIKEAKTLLTYREHLNDIYFVGILQDNKRACTYEKCLGQGYLWNIETGETLHRMCCLSAYSLVAVSKQSDDWLLFKDRAGDLHIYSWSAYKFVASFRADSRGSTTTKFYKNESHIVSAGKDGTLRIFDANSGKLVYAFFQHQAQSYTTLAISPNENVILAGNKNGRIYQLQSESG